MLLMLSKHHYNKKQRDLKSTASSKTVGDLDFKMSAKYFDTKMIGSMRAWTFTRASARKSNQGGCQNLPTRLYEKPIKNEMILVIYSLLG